MRMHPSQDSVFVPNFQVGKNGEKLIACKRRLVETIAGETCAVVSDGLKVPPIMLRKIGDALPCVVLGANFNGLPLEKLLDVDNRSDYGCDFSKSRLRPCTALCLQRGRPPACELQSAVASV